MGLPFDLKLKAVETVKGDHGIRIGIADGQQGIIIDLGLAARQDLLKAGDRRFCPIEGPDEIDGLVFFGDVPLVILEIWELNGLDLSEPLGHLRNFSGKGLQQGSLYRLDLADQHPTLHNLDKSGDP